MLIGQMQLKKELTVVILYSAIYVNLSSVSYRDTGILF